MSRRPVAFYAPLKPPDHPAPSGDRAMARLFVEALTRAGYAPHIASSLRGFDGTGDPDTQERLRREALAEADRLVAACRSGAAERPLAWFTYHVYYKAPDWIGPRVADALAIPYLVAEGSRAAKRAHGPWALGHRGAEAALDRADIVFVMTDVDREALERARPAGQRLVDLPPFIDLGAWGLDGAAPPSPPDSARRGDARPALLTVAMMRAGDKLASFAILADALRRIDHLPWTLDIVGDGPARADVERLFTPLGERVRLRGLVEDRSALAALYGGADLFVWPAVNEAYGMVLLEAQAFGCPVAAGAYGGVASVVRDGETGRLTVPGDAAAFASTVADLLADAARRGALGRAAAAFVRGERGIDRAARTLAAALDPLVAFGMSA